MPRQFGLSAIQACARGSRVWIHSARLAVLGLIVLGCAEGADTGADPEQNAGESGAGAVPGAGAGGTNVPAGTGGAAAGSGGAPITSGGTIGGTGGAGGQNAGGNEGGHAGDATGSGGTGGIDGAGGSGIAAGAGGAGGANGAGSAMGTGGSRGGTGGSRAGERPDRSCDGAEFDGHTYWLCTDSHNWDEARAECQSAGGDLASINSAAEQDFLAAQTDANQWLIGLHKKNASGGSAGGDWEWVDGTDLSTYEHWGNSEPDNDDCGMLENGFWRDSSCNDSENWICEVP